jgi:hypothetical protein
LVRWRTATLLLLLVLSPKRDIALLLRRQSINGFHWRSSVPLQYEESLGHSIFYLGTNLGLIDIRNVRFMQKNVSKVLHRNNTAESYTYFALILACTPDLGR